MTIPVWTALRTGRRPNVSAIVSGLLVGEYPTVDDIAWLRDVHGVTAVVNLQDHPDLVSKGLEAEALRAACRDLGMQWHHVPVPDGNAVALRRRLETALPLLGRLSSAGECIYLHCNAGYNRAPTVAIAHLHVNCGLSREAAVHAVTARRVCVPYLEVI